MVKYLYKKACYWKWVKRKNNRPTEHTWQLTKSVVIFTENQRNYND